MKPGTFRYLVDSKSMIAVVLLLLLVFLPNSPLRLLLGLARPVTEALIGA